MSAEVSCAEVYYVWCEPCATNMGPFDSENEAEAWAAQHDAEHHETDNSTDEDYERFKEARNG